MLATAIAMTSPPGLLTLTLGTSAAGYPAPAARRRVPAYCYSTPVDKESPAPAPARARPVADVPVDGLIARSPELARDWALALVAQLPPGRIGEIPLPALAEQAPALCAHVLRALTSDGDLDLLTGRARSRGQTPPAHRLVEVSGASDGAGMALAAEALRGVMWEALLAEMGRASAREVGDLSDRLAHVCACTLAAALESAWQQAPATSAPAGGGRPPQGAPVPAAGSLASGRSAVQIVDDLDPEPPAGEAEPSAGEGPAQIEIRDQRVRPGPSAWIATIGHRLEAFRRERRPFSVLLIEPMEPARGDRAEELAGVTGLADRIERALAAELNSGAAGTGEYSEVLTREAPGRWWVLSAESERAGADALASRLSRAAEAITDGQGEPVRIAVGTAVCPTDGREPAALAAHADVGLYAARAAARAAGRRVTAAADDAG